MNKIRTKFHLNYPDRGFLALEKRWKEE